MLAAVAPFSATVIYTDTVRESMVYYIAYIAEGRNNVEYTKFNNKDELIDYLILGFTTDNYTGLHRTLKACKEEAEHLLNYYEEYPLED